MGAEQQAALAARHHLPEVMFPVKVERKPVRQTRHEHHSVYQCLAEKIVIAVNALQGFRAAKADPVPEETVLNPGGPESKYPIPRGHDLQ
jgi:hypothetical protein